MTSRRTWGQGPGVSPVGVGSTVGSRWPGTWGPAFGARRELCAHGRPRRSAEVQVAATVAGRRLGWPVVVTGRAAGGRAGPRPAPAGRHRGPAAVTWVHSSDLVDPTPFVGTGHLLLTTGTQFAGDDPGRTSPRTCARLVAAGVRGSGSAPRWSARHPGRWSRPARPGAAAGRGALPDAVRGHGPLGRRRAGRAGARPRRLGPAGPAGTVPGRPLRRAARRGGGGAGRRLAAA